MLSLCRETIRTNKDRWYVFPRIKPELENGRIKKVYISYFTSNSNALSSTYIKNEYFYRALITISLLYIPISVNHMFSLGKIWRKYYLMYTLMST